MTNSIPEIRDVDLLFVIGSNTTEAHPIVGMEMKRARRRGAALFVADPRKIWLAERADLHLQLRPGTDVALLTAMAQVIIAEGLVDQAFVGEHTEGYEQVAASVRENTPEWAEGICGVPAEQIRTVARAYATTRRAAIFYTLGITEHTHGTDNVYALSNLVLLTGHLGQVSAGLNPLRGQNNVQGANDAGASPTYLPGYQRVSDPDARARFGAAWGVTVPELPGLGLNDMMKELAKGRLKALYIVGEDIVMSEPNAERIERGLNQAELVVVQDIFLTETARYADVVLPAACFAEKEGVFTNSDRRVQRVRKAVDAPGEALADWQILVQVAQRLGYAMPDYEHPSQVYAEMASLCDKFAGISHQRIDAEGGLQWPCPTPEHPGTPTLHRDGPLRGKALLQPVFYRPSAELADQEFPLVLSTGRVLIHYNAGTMTRRAKGAAAREPENFIELHRADARQRGVGDGELVRVSSRRGVVTARARISERVRRGCVWMPFHFPESNTNRLTNEAGDVVTGTGEYKVCAVQVERA